MPISPEQATIRPPHPLAVQLVDDLRSRPQARVIEFGTGSGRNQPILLDAGFDVHPIDDELAVRSDALARAGTAAAVLSTHALLHGTTASIGDRVDSIAGALTHDGRLYATFGHVDDSRYGTGRQLAARTFAPEDGDERGIPHTYFSEAGLRALLGARFTIESLVARDVDRIAGTWAHAVKPLRGAVHWFVVATRTR